MVESDRAASSRKKGIQESHLSFMSCLSTLGRRVKPSTQVHADNACLCQEAGAHAQDLAVAWELV